MRDWRTIERTGLGGVSQSTAVLRERIRAASGFLSLEILFEVHACVHAGDLVGVAVEHLGWNGVGQEAGVDATLVSLRPAGMIDLGIDVGVETVLIGSHVVPEGAGLLVGEVKFDDAFGALETVLPRQDDTDGSAVLVGENLAVTAKGEQSKGVHGFVHAEAFGVGPVVAAGEVGHLLTVEVGEELDVLCFGERLAEVDELGEGVAVPRDDHGPGFDAAVAVDAALDGAVLDDVVDAEGERLIDKASDLDGPGAGLKGVGVACGVGFVGAELIEVVVAGGLVEGRLVVGEGVLAGGGFELLVGVDGLLGAEDSGCKGSRAQGSGSSNEVATIFVELLDDVLRGDFGGGNVGAGGPVEEHD